MRVYESHFWRATLPNALSRLLCLVGMGVCIFALYERWQAGTTW